MNEVDFPVSVDRGGSSWAVRVSDVFTDINANYAKDKDGNGTKGLFIEIVNERSGKTRQVFFPEPSGEGKKKKVPQRTRQLLTQLEKLGMAPDKIGGWKGLIGTRFAWTKEERSFKDKAGKEVTYEIEFPIKVLSDEDEGPIGAVTTSSNGNGATATSLFDELKALALEKSKTELRFAIATNTRLSEEFGDKFQDNAFIDSMVEDGIWAIVDNKIVRGENY